MKVYTQYRQHPNEPESHRANTSVEIVKPPKAAEPVRIKTQDGRTTLYLTRDEALTVGQLVGMQTEHRLGLEALAAGGEYTEHIITQDSVYTSRTTRPIVMEEVGQNGEILPVYEANARARRAVLTPETLRAVAARMLARADLIEDTEDPQWGSEA